MKKMVSVLRSFGPSIVILAFGAYLRLHDISLYMTFLGDEGRDVIIVRRMIVEGKWTLLGPTASVGGFFMGPIYYYFMLPFLWLWNFNPVGPAIMVALFGIATIYLIYLVGKRMFGFEVGVIGSALYAVSPLIIAYSRSSWNPNIVPFFATLLFFFLWDVVVHTQWKRLFWIGCLLGIGLQLHYTFLFLFGVSTIWFLLNGRKISYVKYYLLGILGFIIGFFPFLAFEVRHSFMNSRSILSFVFEGKDTGFSFSHFISNIIDVYFRLFGRLMMRVPEKGVLGNLPFFEKTALVDLTGIFCLSGLILIIALLADKKRFVTLLKLDKKRSEEFFYGIYLLILWLGIVLAFFGLYKKTIYDYYSGIMFFIPFILTGCLYSLAYYMKGIWRYVGIVLISALVFYNVLGMPFRYAPNNQLGQVERIAKEIIANTDGKPFNFALITGGNSDHAYRYFFDLWGYSPITIENDSVDPQRKTVTDQLLIVCEDISCKPLGNSLWEVAGFGRAEIVKEWDVSVVKLFKLIHYKGDTSGL